MPVPFHRHLLSGIAALLALALLLTGCGGTDKGDRKGADSTETAPTSTATPRSTKAAADPGFQAPRIGTCTRMTYAQSRASVAPSRRARCRGRHTSVVSRVVFLPQPVSAATPVARRDALGQRYCAPAYRQLVGGTLADRATSLLTWTLFTPSEVQLARGARWLRCEVLARSGTQLVPLPLGRPLLGKGVPEQLRTCQTTAGADVTCGRPHAFRVEAVFRAIGEAYPDARTFTATARDRCQQLVGSYGGFWQPPSRAGWAAGDRFVRCLTRTG
jgi:hypothetical protein